MYAYTMYYDSVSNFKVEWTTRYWGRLWIACLSGNFVWIILIEVTDCANSITHFWLRPDHFGAYEKLLYV